MFLLLENHYVYSLYMNKQFPETLKYEVHFTKNYIEFNLALENPEYLVFQCVSKSQSSALDTLLFNILYPWKTNKNKSKFHIFYIDGGNLGIKMCMLYIIWSERTNRNRWESYLVTTGEELLNSFLFWSLLYHFGVRNFSKMQYMYFLSLLNTVNVI